MSVLLALAMVVLWGACHPAQAEVGLLTFEDGLGKPVTVSLQDPDPPKKGNVSFGYFYDIGDESLLRGFKVDLARKKISRIPLTLAAGGLMKSMDIGDLDGTFVITTDLGAVMDQLGWEFTYSEKVEIGPFFSFFRDTRYGLFSTVRW